MALIMPTPEEDAQITAAALTDPDNLPLTDAELKQFKRGRGRPSGSGKKESEYISYERAMAQLRERLGATPEELAAWMWMSEPKQVCAKLNEKRERCSNEVLQRGDKCKEHGGKPIQKDEIKAVRRRSLYAYLHARELNPPPQFFFGNHGDEHDYLPLLYQLYFKIDDVAQFEPSERFITGRALLGRWANQTEIPPTDRIRIATQESRLNPFHPILGLTQATAPNDPFYAQLEDGLVSLAEVRVYEREEFGRELDAPAAKSGTVERSISKGEVINAFDGLHFGRSGWNNALSDVPEWIKPCRVTLGRKGDNTTPATWNPVLIAVALIDKGITPNKLDAVFVRLKDWVDEWREASANDR